MDIFVMRIPVNKQDIVATNPIIAQLQNDLNVKITEFQELQKRNLDLLIEEQKKCHHELIKVEIPDPEQTYHLHLRDRILSHHYCAKCLIIIPKRTDCRSQVCYYCGGDMEYHGLTPGQGGRTHHYKCKECHKTYSHT